MENFFLPERQGQNTALTVVCVPYSLDRREAVMIPAADVKAALAIEVDWHAALQELASCRANTAYIRQSRPDSGLEIQVKVSKPVLLSSLSGYNTSSRRQTRVGHRTRLATPLSRASPMSSEYGTYRRVKARLLPWFSGQRALNLSSSSLLALASR